MVEGGQNGDGAVDTEKCGEKRGHAGFQRRERRRIFQSSATCRETNQKEQRHSRSEHLHSYNHPAARPKPTRGNTT
jgi:hypothetical protein